MTSAPEPGAVTTRTSLSFFFEFIFLVFEREREREERDFERRRWSFAFPGGCAGGDGLFYLAMPSLSLARSSLSCSGKLRTDRFSLSCSPSTSKEANARFPASESGEAKGARGGCA